jgi:branched-subunit amino acid transport protein
MTALLAALLLAGLCWTLRALMVVMVPAERLPVSVREALDHLAPAVLASLVAAGLVGAVRNEEPLAALVVLGGMTVAAVLARRTNGLALAVGCGALIALVVDLLLT